MSKNKESANAESVNFEDAMAELEKLVAQMEEGDLSLDESLQAFERGVMLTRQCQQALSQAELRVQALTDTDTLVDLDPDAS
ncbi:MAG TPA: exodeoxyribonuclease VII small subunit [Gammaproteobacteria bacterium]|jgi:exodeoxyribonuclease VII small subunit|nr:exodeoxyribonuclease VII small subunit [Gammaproteobacteria bacterium]HCG69249.1 exodeoxyribonuclease VII small subunit [Gammaproteobacteria bacterium]